MIVITVQWTLVIVIAVQWTLVIVSSATFWYIILPLIEGGPESTFIYNMQQPIVVHGLLNIQV